MDRKDSSHVVSPDYIAEMTHHKEERWRLSGQDVPLEDQCSIHENTKNLERPNVRGCVRVCTTVYCGLLGQLDVEEGPSGLWALDGNKDSSKHRGMLRATRISSGRLLTNSRVRTEQGHTLWKRNG